MVLRVNQEFPRFSEFFPNFSVDFVLDVIHFEDEGLIILFILSFDWLDGMVLLFL